MIIRSKRTQALSYAAALSTGAALLAATPAVAQQEQPTHCPEVSIQGAGDSYLSEGQALFRGQRLRSDDGRTEAELTNNGKFLVRAEKNLRWSTVWTAPANDLVAVKLSERGQLQLLDARGQVKKTYGPQRQRCVQTVRLVVDGDGKIRIVHDDTTVWTSPTQQTPKPDPKPDPEPEDPENHNGDNRLRGGEFLAPGDELFSKNEKFALKFNKNGNVVLRNKAGDKLWSTDTAGKRGAKKFFVRADGNLVLENRRGRVLFDTDTVADKPRNPRLVLTNKGELKLKHGRDTVWTSEKVVEDNDRSFEPGDQLRSREQIFSENGRYKLKLRKNGQLILRDTDEKETIWKAGTRKSGATRLELRKNGNLVLLNRDGDVVWETDTASRNVKETSLKIRNNGTLELLVDGDSVWRAP